MSAMYLLYSMILFANDNRITTSELAALGTCFAILLFIAALILVVYRVTLRQIRQRLNIS